MGDYRQFILAGIVFAVPALLLLKRRESLLVKWICLTVAIDVFDAKLIVNLPAARVTGLLLLPTALTYLAALYHSRAAKALLARYSYLVLLGVVFGFLFPWSSEGFLRDATQVAPVRAVVYLIRSAADIGLLLFIAQYVLKTRRPDWVVEQAIVGTSLASLGGILQLLTHVDLYEWINGLTASNLEDRMRGFNYEPRGLGLIAAHGFLFSLLLYSRRRSLKWMVLAALHAIAIFLTVSTSSLFAVGAGLAAMIVFRAGTRGLVAAATCAALVLALVVPASQFFGNWMETWRDNMQLRLSSNKIGSASKGPLEELALRMDIFDASAFLFLSAKPAYLVVGTGPGLVGIPSTNYIPQAALWNWVWREGAGLNTVPHMGVLRELSDAGLVGLLLWLSFLWPASKAVLLMRKIEEVRDGPWSIGAGAFFVATSIYVVDASPLSAIWSVFLGIGLAAVQISEEFSPPVQVDPAIGDHVLAHEVVPSGTRFSAWSGN